jgi:nucleotide-binding universal stress UspA family protein
MTVVVGVDNSPASRAALELAAQEARWRQAPLVAVSAFEPPLGTAVAGYPAAAMHTEGEQKATAESELRAAVDDTLGGQGIQADLRVSAGLAGRVIIETARQTNAQLVVLAAHPARSVLPGTVSQYVLLKARCPVTIVPAEDKEDEQDSGARSSRASRPGQRLSAATAKDPASVDGPGSATWPRSAPIFQAAGPDVRRAAVRALRAIPPVEYANREEVARSLPDNPAADRGLSAAQRTEQARERNRRRGLSQLDREVPKPIVEEELER